MKQSTQRRNAAQLSEPLTRQLNLYALAASAAGVGVLALAQPAEAKIVYTPAHVSIPPQTIYPPVYLDLNHDGVNDFSFINYSVFNYWWGFIYLAVTPPVEGNGVIGQKVFASALRAGARIGPKGNFLGYEENLAAYSFYVSTGGKSSHHIFGPWANDGKGVKNRYVGLKFLIKGQIHFGWARLNVTVDKQHGTQFTGLLTGYAYETIPNKPIVTGKIKGPDVITVKPDSLGQLAAGSAGLTGRR